MRTHLLCIALLAACGSSNDNATEDGAIDMGDTRGTTLAAQARGDFQGAADADSSAMAAAIVTTLNAGEIAQATFILSTSTNDAVRELAAQIQADHQANDLALHAMMQDRGLTPVDNEISLTLQDEGDASLAQLQGDATSDLDFDYAKMQVSMHQEASVLVDALRDLVSDGDLRDFLSDTKDAIDSHRDHAGDVLNDL